ncbi:MAG: HAD-IIA family hydrolase [Actinomycetota bacterium]|nr:HAD-IIA family hydrolase [Actinomycetota bacterium]
MLKESGVALCRAYDLAMLDLDGVVYIGATAVDGAPGHLAEASASGMHLAYITNNASRPPSVVADHLRDLGIPVEDEDVVNSAQAAARLVAERVPCGSAVYVIGGTGLFEALEEQSLVPVQSIDDAPAAVVSGFAPDLLWRTVIDGAILVKQGLPWIASNLDLTVPTVHGPGPGNGVLVEAVGRYAGRDPVVAGKPERPLFEETLRRVAGERPLVVGDRLDTDIEGAVNSGFDSLLVMTGVTGLDALVRAQPRARPSYISGGLGGLVTCHPAPTGTDGLSLNGWSAEVESGSLVVRGEGSLDDWWRIMASTAWTYLDTHGQPVDVSAVTVPG